MATALLFPGQGSQQIGMGRELADHFASAREVFDEVDEALGQKLTNVIWQGRKEDLTLTENAQPALMAVSLAVMRVLEVEKGVKLAAAAHYVAGHSLGEYSALAAAGALSLADTARLLRIRGRAMQQAVPVGEGAMVALLGVGVEVGAKLAQAASRDCQGDVCQVANDNEPRQVVLSGSKRSIERVMQIAGDYKDLGLRRALPLPVSAPFHCALMQPAADAMAEALGQVTINKPVVPLVANVLASAITDPDDIRQRLIEQVTGTVRWRESMAYLLANGVTALYELGAGKVLTGLAGRVDKSLSAAAVGDVASINAAAAELAG